MKKSHFLLIISLMVSATAGCTVPTSDTQTAVTPEPAPTVTVTASSAPAERTPDSPLTPLDVYALCKLHSSFIEVAGTQQEDLVYTPFSDARIEQIDSKWYAMMGVSAPTFELSTVFCTVSGTIGDPVWGGSGVSIGAPGDQMWDEFLNGGA